MAEEKKVEISEAPAGASGKDGDAEKVEAVGIPFLPDKFATIFDNADHPTVMVFTVPIRSLASDPQGLAMLLGKIELFKGDAHRIYKAIKAEEAAKGPVLITPQGKKITFAPEGNV